MDAIEGLVDNIQEILERDPNNIILGMKLKYGYILMFRWRLEGLINILKT